MKILVADDDAVYRHLLQRTLAGWGYDVLVAADGNAAWRVLEGDDAPDLVILDWVMPGMDGDQICRLVRQRPRTRYPYVLLLTSKRNKSDLLSGLEAGADDYLSKPFDPAELRARLNAGRRILDLQAELIAAREEMRRQAMRDSLTGLWNHAAILEILKRELGRARREDRPVAVLLADLDHFKQINDTHGHLAGDAALHQVTERIVKIMRPYDLIGRYGGEEFLIVLPGCDAASAFKIGERIREHVGEQTIQYDDRTFPVTISVGAAVLRIAGADDGVGLVRAADAALYRAKSAGRNRVELSTSS